MIGEGTHDVVVFGDTGYTGRLVCKYLREVRESAPLEIEWRFFSLETHDDHHRPPAPQ